MVLASVTILLALHVDVSAIFSVIALVVTPVMTFVLYGKVQDVQASQEKITTQTNGLMSNRDELLKDLIDHIKKTSPPTDA